MASVPATSQPFSRDTCTVTGAQSRFCITAVGASTKVPPGEYSMRTRVGVRKEKRAWSATTTGWPDFTGAWVQAARHSEASSTGQAGHLGRRTNILYSPCFNVGAR